MAPARSRRRISRQSRPTPPRRPGSSSSTPVGVTEHDFVDPPLNREKGIALKQLLGKAAALTLTEAETATLASRLAALELQLTPAERAELDAVAGTPVRGIVRGLVDACDPGAQARVREAAGSPEEAESAVEQLLLDAVTPLAANLELGSASSSSERPTTGSSTRSPWTRSWTRTGWSTPGGRGRSSRAGGSTLKSTVTRSPRFRSWPRRERRLSFGDIQELADRIRRPPYGWTPDIIWAAYEAVEAGRSAIATTTRSRTWSRCSVTRSERPTNSCRTPIRCASGTPPGSPSRSSAGRLQFGGAVVARPDG